eukprot:CAMPEP_0197928954 /NCGR_PEP_ID=MMETSP1439-20131203/103148_1 /TAXON_ID=66791 /ORGANISM="Gonyaulax spinifera, Strain CCMP409" /LENGTH=136 /DNA_ID=CAMNT_0043551577 /DNA_START=269 /DNA_END=676 /DNA_ORIENTATION=-
MADLLAGRGGSPILPYSTNASDVFREEDGQRGVAARHAWPNLRGRELHQSDAPRVVPAYETEAVVAVMSARKLGPHHLSPGPGQVRDKLRAFFNSANPTDWYFLALVMLVLVMMDILVLQQLPETARTHIVLLMFW